jgi:hypothetical protein
MRSARAVLAAVLVAGLVGLVAIASLTRTDLGFTLGVVSTAPVAALERGQEVCQQPIDVPGGGSFNRVAFRVGTFNRPHGPRLAVAVRDLGGRLLAHGDLPAGYPDIGVRPVERVRLDRSVGPGRISVCLANDGEQKVAVYGGADAAARSSRAFVDGKAVPADIELAFNRTPRSLAELTPRIFERAALFGFSWEGAWLYWALAIAVLLGGPWLLWRAIVSGALGR